MEPAVLPRPVDHSRPIRVLVVDDNAGFRESLLSLLEAGNLQVVGEAGSGAEALGLVRTRRSSGGCSSRGRPATSSRIPTVTRS